MKVDLSRVFRFVLISGALAGVCPVWGQAESAPPPNPVPPSALEAKAYIRPPKAIEDLVTAPWYRNVSLGNLSPDGKSFLIARSMGAPTLADLSRPYYLLAGEKIDPRGNRDRALNLRGSVGLELFNPVTGSRTEIRLPSGGRVSGQALSPDGSKLACLLHKDQASLIYVADTKTGHAFALTNRPVLATAVTSLQWVDQGRAVVTVLVPRSRPAPPAQTAIPAQPRVEMTDPSTNRIPTYRGLLETARDDDLFEYYQTGQLARIDVASRKVDEIGKPAMIQSVDASPDGKHFRVTTMDRPFSHEVLASSFPRKEEIWDSSGKVLAELSKQPLRVGTPPTPPATAPATGRGPGGGAPGAGAGRGQRGGGGGGTNDKRSIVWRPDGAGLSFLQLEPLPERQAGSEGGATPQAAAQRKDRVMLWVAPFGKDDTKVVYESPRGIGSVSYSADCQTVFLTETNNGVETLKAVSLKEPDKPKNIYSYTTGGENPQSPGTLMMDTNANGRSAVRVSPAGFVFLSGTQQPADPEKGAPRPFLDKVEIASGTKTRLWQSPEDKYQTLSALLGEEGTQLVIRSQSASEIPNDYLVGVGSADGPKKLTDNRDYAPSITQAKRLRFQVKRADGIKFWVNVTIPRDAADRPKLPAFFWFYPSEFTDQASYDRSTRNRNRNLFPTLGLSSKSYLLAEGYALVEPDCPIIGTEGRMNDRYVTDLRANLWAVIDDLDKKGLVDRDKLAIGGHSYGAFSTVHAMIQTPFFKAGIAGDGNYNRTLTPATFQSERRTLWEAKDTYMMMSPILNAEQLTGALLMYHGLDDQNTGTDPINSERLFHALQNLGKTASLYMYPFEDHGPVAMETHLDMWARWIAWLDKYVKGEGK